MKSKPFFKASLLFIALSALPVCAAYSASDQRVSMQLTLDAGSPNLSANPYYLADVRSEFLNQEQNRQSAEERCESLKYYFVFAPDPGGSSTSVGEYAIDNKGRIFTRGRDDSGCDNAPQYLAKLMDPVRLSCPSEAAGRGYTLTTWLLEKGALVKYTKYVDWYCGHNHYGSQIVRDVYPRLYYCGDELVSRRYIDGMVKAGFRRFAKTCRGL